MNLRSFVIIFGCWLFLLASTVSLAVSKLKIQGSTTVNPVVSDAAQVFRDKGWKITVDTQGGSSGGISALGEGLVDIGMSSKPVTEIDRKRFPKVNFVQHTIGYDGVAVVVSRPVYESGVKKLNREQIQKIYEGKIKNWKQVGGFDKPIVFFNKEPGRGTWEVFAKFLYDDTKKAPKVFHPEVGANEEARAKVGSHPSAMTQLSLSWATDQEKLAPLAIINEKNEIIDPTIESVESGKYPLTRTLFVLTNGQPKDGTKTFIDYLKTTEGQGLLVKHGYLAVGSKP